MGRSSLTAIHSTPRNNFSDTRRAKLYQATMMNLMLAMCIVALSWTVSVKGVNGFCIDIDGGVVDKDGDGCGWYTSHPGSCGEYDDANFTAASLCCACGGGTPGECIDTDQETDNGGDTCAWYYHQPQTCGEYDNTNFKAKEMCCACKGCDPKCGCGYYSTEKMVMYNDDVRDTSVVQGQDTGLQGCWEKCGARHGCTGFKYSDKICDTFTNVIKNHIHSGLSEKPNTLRHITTCLRSI